MGTRTSRATRRSIGVLAALTLSLAAACSGGDGGATTTVPAPTSTTSTTSSTASTTTTRSPDTTAPTTTTPRPPADAATVELARAATLHAGDFGDGWEVATKPAATKLSESTCTFRRGGPEASLRAGASQRGARMQWNDLDAVVSSTSWAFADDRAAFEWIRTVNSAEWAECAAERLERAARRRDPASTVRLERRDIEHLGVNGFEGFAEFYERDGSGRVVRAVQFMHYRNGRVVTEDVLERSTALDDSDWQAVDSAHRDAFHAMWSRVNALHPNR